MKKTLLVLSLVTTAFISFGQKRTIVGQLISYNDSIPIKNAPVLLYGTIFNTKTDDNGYFEMKRVKPGSAELIIGDDKSFNINNDYYPISIRNIGITRNTTLFDLGKIPMIEMYSIKSADELPYIIRNDIKYWYSMQEGMDRLIFDGYLLADLTKPDVKGQYLPPPKLEGLPSIVDYRFPGGSYALVKFLSKRIEYPKSAIESNKIGLSIASCSLTPTGSIDTVIIINPICPSIDKEVRELLLSTNEKWYPIKKDTVETFYVQVHFHLMGISYNEINLVAENVLKPINITMKKISSKTSYVYRGDNLSNKKIEITEENYGNEKDSEEYIASEIMKSINEKKYKRALSLINETIRRNPYDPNLYQLRIMINTKLGNRAEVMDDVTKTANFMNGKSLQNMIEGK